MDLRHRLRLGLALLIALADAHRVRRRPCLDPQLHRRQATRPPPRREETSWSSNPSLRSSQGPTSLTPTGTLPPPSAWSTRFPSGMVAVDRSGQVRRRRTRRREHHHRDEPGATWMPRPFVGRSTGRTERQRPRRRAGGPSPVPGDVAPEGRDHLRLQREASGTDRARPPGRGSRETTAASPDASTAPSRAGSRSSTQPKRGTRSTATRGPATPRTSGSSTSRGPA